MVDITRLTFFPMNIKSITSIIVLHSLIISRDTLCVDSKPNCEVMHSLKSYDTLNFTFLVMFIKNKIPPKNTYQRSFKKLAKGLLKNTS